jgi:hypothetical protein
MNQLSFGQPVSGIIQSAYTVSDIEAAIWSYAADLRIGPWFLRGPRQSGKPVYPGKPQALNVSIAISFSGHMMIELIQQHDDAPSIYQEVIARQGHGFHHWGVGSARFDEDAQDYEHRGFELVYTNETPAGTRVAYFDAHRGWPGFIELIEINPVSELRYAKMYAEALIWDGKEAIRRV